MLTASVLSASSAAAVVMRGMVGANSRVFGPVIGRGPRDRGVYLSFDDGPNPRATGRILRVLEQERVPATFFMVGRYVERYPELARAVAAAGCGIGNHTFTHAKLALLGPRRISEEVGRAHSAIVELTGVHPRAFRAPHGYRNPFVHRVVARYRYRVFGWTLGVWDSARPGADVIRARVRRRIRAGAILLLHDGDGYEPAGDRTQTAEALPGIIDDCREMGYELRSLDQLEAG
ncbi:MAG TPA: polysaccharide deacetylase family protein [Gemmatimonadales bacterium]|nr:polysaccharide deacetylase family protein [Gemmatimonadales bacterium]